jgi:hypothetical protein
MTMLIKMKNTPCAGRTPQSCKTQNRTKMAPSDRKERRQCVTPSHAATRLRRFVEVRLAPENEIDPQYLPEWNRFIKNVLTDRWPDWENGELQDRTLIQFEQGMWREQVVRSRKWMRESLERSGSTRAEAGDRLDVHPSHIGRWLTGETDLGFERFQHFYVCFGLNESDAVLNSREVLNLGGYRRAVSFIESELKRQTHNPITYRAEAALNVDSLLCLYHFYANHDPRQGLMEQEQKRKHLSAYLFDDVRTTLFPFVPPSEVSIQSVDDFIEVVRKWGAAWLICLKMLADEADGASEYFVSARRPIRLGPVEEGLNGK